MRPRVFGGPIGFIGGADARAGAPSAPRDPAERVLPEARQNARPRAYHTDCTSLVGGARS